MPTIKLTSAQDYIVHGLLSLLAAALLAGLTAGGQALFHGGQISLPLVLASAWGAFLGVFIHGFIGLRNAPQMTQAERDLLAQVAQVLPQVASQSSWLNWIVNEINALKGTNAASARPVLQEPVSLVAAGQAPT